MAALQDPAADKWLKMLGVSHIDDFVFEELVGGDPVP
jgi:hypothetical protein